MCSQYWALRSRSALRGIYYAQTRFKNKNQNYADDLEALSDSLYPKSVAEGTSPGYLVLLRRSADGQKWMAVAAPEEPGKTGRYFYVTNHEGKTYRSKTAIELDEGCAIPAGAELVR